MSILEGLGDCVVGFSISLEGAQFMTMLGGPIEWEGATQIWQDYFIYDIGAITYTEWQLTPGNYIFAYYDAVALEWKPLYIGESGELAKRLPHHEKLPCVRKLGGTHVHVRFHSTDNEDARKAEENDLLDKYISIHGAKPPCHGQD